MARPSAPLSSSTPWKLTLALIVLSMSEVSSAYKLTYDLKIKYFSNGHLKCDHPMLNITKRNDVEALYWIFEDGSVIAPDSYLNPKRFLLQGLPVGETGASQPATKYDGYNLTVLEVEDDVFGYYTCVVLFTPSPDHDRIAAIRYGLNIDGADFSDLLDEYKHNAIVGGIAAGGMLALLGIACFVWYYYCNGRVPGEVEEGELEEMGGVEVGGAGGGSGSRGGKGDAKDNDGGTTFHNEAFSGEKTGMESFDNGVKDKEQEANVRL